MHLSDLDFLAYTTKIGSKIERLTDVSAEFNISDHIRLCDQITTAKNREDAARAFKKRLGNTDGKVLMLTIYLLETCMQNCGTAFHNFIIKEDFVERLVELAKQNDEVGRKCRNCIAVWAMGLEGNKQRYYPIINAFESLQKLGLPFEEVDPSTFINLAPKNNDAITTGIKKRSNGSGISHTDIAKLSKDLDYVTENIKAYDVIIEVEKAKDEPNIKDNRFLKDVVKSTREMLCRVQRLLQTLSAADNIDETFMKKLFSTNDNLTHMFETHKDLLIKDSMGRYSAPDAVTANTNTSLNTTTSLVSPSIESITKYLEISTLRDSSESIENRLRPDQEDLLGLSDSVPTPEEVTDEKLQSHSNINNNNKIGTDNGISGLDFEEFLNESIAATDGGGDKDKEQAEAKQK